MKVVAQEKMVNGSVRRNVLPAAYDILNKSGDKVGQICQGKSYRWRNRRNMLVTVWVAYIGEQRYERDTLADLVKMVEGM